ncbi:MAG: hypothetical protein HY816_01025 [Candidatus Wallbacteria bacterium]|nr:hypothetical protein [Candidatus Wallbacteria bacterium]
MNGILLVSHCILNPYTAVGGSVPNREAMQALVRWSLERDVALLQMPCPEFTHAGASRKPRTLEGYDVPQFRAHCAELATRLAETLGEHRAAGHTILGIVGVDGSPSCGVELTTRECDGSEAKVAGEGVFTRQLREELRGQGWELPYVGLPHRRQTERQGNSWTEELDRLLGEKSQGSAA